MNNPTLFKIGPVRGLLFGALLVLPVGLLLAVFIFDLGTGRRQASDIPVFVLIALLIAVGAIWIRFLSERVEITDSAITVMDCFGSRSFPYKGLYRVGRGFWGRGNCCVAITDTRMKVIRVGRFFSGKMIDEVVKLVSARARDLVW
jgi:hypothetical protein